MECLGCEKEAVTKKGWCSIQCYRANQNLVQNSGRMRVGHSITEEHRQTLINLGRAKKGNVDYIQAFVKRCNTPEANAKKSHKKEAHPKWIEDRTKLKPVRGKAEEADFFKQVLEERGYRCELTGQIGGKLSVHHLDSVHLFPNKRFDKSNVVVIRKDIHFDFHKQYGFQWATKEKWIDYITNKFKKHAFC